MNCFSKAHCDLATGVLAKCYRCCYYNIAIQQGCTTQITLRAACMFLLTQEGSHSYKMAARRM